MYILECDSCIITFICRPEGVIVNSMDGGFSLGPPQASLAIVAIDLINFQHWKCRNGN